MGEVRYTESIEIEAPIERVYGYRLDYRNLPSYNPDVSDFARIDDGDEPGVGATYSFNSTTDYGTVPGRIWVVEATHPTRIVHALDFGLTGREEMTFERIPNGTRLTFDVTINVPDDLDQAGRDFIEQSGRKPVQLELENIKKALEG